jgi:hypothetical protein
LIERWAHSAHDEDLDGDLVEDGRDVVVFAAPLPDQGVRWIDAFRETARV